MAMGYLTRFLMHNWLHCFRSVLNWKLMARSLIYP